MADDGAGEAGRVRPAGATYLADRSLRAAAGRAGAGRLARAIGPAAADAGRLAQAIV